MDYRVELLRESGPHGGHPALPLPVICRKTWAVVRCGYTENADVRLREMDYGTL